MPFFNSFRTIVTCALAAQITLSAHDVHDVFVGYPKDKEPVKATEEAIDPQEVFNTTTTIYLQAAVEPTIAINPKHKEHVVTCWQQSRISNGGALELGIAFSKDGGKIWHTTTVPFQVVNGGVTQRVSEPWLSFSRDGHTLYLTALAFNANTDPRTNNQQGIAIALSKNSGELWEAPRFITASVETLNEPTRQFAIDDKPSVTSDRNITDFAYVVWSHFPLAASTFGITQISRTENRGLTWTSPRQVYNPFPDLTLHGLSNGNNNDCFTENNIVLVLPRKKTKPHDSRSLQRRLNGDLLNFMTRTYARPGATNAQFANDTFPYQFTLFDIAFVRSDDHGESWDEEATVVTPFVDAPVFTGGYTYLGNQITGGVGTKMRTGDFVPSYTVNRKNGYLYVVWQTGQFRADQLPQIALTTSRDGGVTWSTPVKINRTPSNSPNPQAFSPFVAVTRDGHVGILYCDFRKDKKTDPNNTKTDVWLAMYQEVQQEDGGSTGIGLDFIREERLSKKSFIAQNGPQTNQGVMTNGDYQFLAAHGHHFYAAYTKSLPGPFAAPTVFLSDPVNNATILLDDNYRQAPFVSILNP